MSTRYTKEHEWIRLDGDVAVVGISQHAQDQLGDIVFVELPEVGLAVNGGDQFAVVESVKAASEVYAPAGGEVVAVNEALADNPALINESPEVDGWFAKIKLSDPNALNDLMDEAAYSTFVADQA